MPRSRPSKVAPPMRYHPFRRRQYHEDDNTLLPDVNPPLNPPMAAAALVVQPVALHENAPAAAVQGENEAGGRGYVYNLAIALLITISIQLFRFLSTQDILNNMLKEKDEEG